MPPKRPTSVLVIAILQLVFGGISLLLGICGGGLMAAGGGKMFNFQPPAQGPQAKQLEYQKELTDALAESQKTLQPIQLGVDVTLSILMIVSGIGLLQMQTWGRAITLAYGLLSIVYHLVAVVLAFTVAVPAFQEVVRQHPPPTEEAKALVGLMQVMSTVGPIVGFFVVIYPIIVLIIMFRPNVVAAFRGETLGPAMDDYDDRFPQGRQAPPDERFLSGDR